MLYVVSGFKRTGTSMMMHALIAGGLDGVYSEQRQHITDKIPEGEYNPNPNGFYEYVGDGGGFPRLVLARVAEAVGCRRSIPGIPCSG